MHNIELDWENVPGNMKQLRDSRAKLILDIVGFEKILKRFNDGTSTLNYTEVEFYREQIEQAKEEAHIWLDLLEKVIAVKEVTEPFSYSG